MKRTVFETVFWLLMLAYPITLFWLGMRWERGTSAQRENAALIQQLEAARAASRELHEMALSIQSEHIASIERLNAIASDFEESRERHTQHFTRQRVALSALLAQRPDLDTPAGADVLRHWETSNAGTGGDAADAAPAADAGGIDAAVSGAADAGQRPLGEFDCEPRCGDGALPPVPDAAPAPDRGGEDVGAERAATLVRSNATRRAGDGGMR